MLSRIRHSFWTYQIAGWLVYYAAIYITFLSVAAEGNFLRLAWVKLFRVVVGFGLTLVLWRIYRLMVHRLSIAATVATVVALCVIFGIVWTGLDNAYSSFLSPDNYDPIASLHRAPRAVLDYAMTLMAWSAIYFGVKYWQRWRDERESALRSTALANKAQLEMLRYQINPHFLFNALNSIRASIDEDAERAKRMITQLSEFLRYSLLHEGEKLTTLREEMEAVRNYLAIEKIRFEEKLDVRYDIDPRAEDFRLPGFILNPLVENAVKHGSRNGGPLTIEIDAHVNGRGLEIEVRNSGSLANGNGNGNGNGDGNGIGLANVRERLERQFGPLGRFAIEQRDGEVVARIEVANKE